MESMELTLVPNFGVHMVYKRYGIAREIAWDTAFFLRKRLAALPRVQGVAQAVAHEVERQYSQEDGQAGVEHQLWLGLDKRPGVVQHPAPLRGGGLRAQSQKGKGRDTQQQVA